MKRLLALIEKARHSKLYLRLLNFLLHRTIPFNKPHGLLIREIYDDGFKIILPYKRKNLNHINGIHACALATLAEYASGITLMLNLASDDYRLIMKNISMTYHYQAKADVFVTLTLKKEWMNERIFLPLKNGDSIFTEVNVDVYDTNQNHICTGLINWQIKKWEKVKTK